MASSDIFYWEPDVNNIKSGITHRTLITNFESGTEQRRSKWAKPKYSVELSFRKYLSQRGVLGDIWSFVKSMQGSYDWFWIPSFLYDTTLTQDYSGGTTLNVSDNARFSITPGAHGNYIYITDGTNREVKQVSTLPDSPERIVLMGALSNTYTITDAPGQVIYVQVAYKVRFASDDYSEDSFVGMVYDSGITFIEVF